jgi:hypothetical protein
LAHSLLSTGIASTIHLSNFLNYQQSQQECDIIQQNFILGRTARAKKNIFIVGLGNFNLERVQGMMPYSLKDEYIEIVRIEIRSKNEVKT